REPSPKPSGAPVSGQTGHASVAGPPEDTLNEAPVLMSACSRSASIVGAAVAGASAAASAFPSPSQSPSASAPGPPQTEPDGSAAQPSQPLSGLRPDARSKTCSFAPPVSSV